MFAKPLGALAAATLALSFAGASRAAVIFDNGPAIGGGFEATESLVADDFKFDDTTTVGGAGVFMDGQIDHWTGGFQYSIYSVVNGAPGAVLTSGDVTTHPVDQGPVDTQEIFLFQFDLATPFVAQAGQSYYLAIHARSDFRDNDGIFHGISDVFEFHDRSLTERDGDPKRSLHGDGMPGFFPAAFSSASNSLIRSCSDSITGPICRCENRRWMCCWQFTSQASMVNVIARSIAAG